MLSRLTSRPLALLVAALLAVGAAVVLWPRDHGYALSADFADTTGIYVGNEVQYLGVPVGKITRIEPRGTVMRVDMEIDSGTKVPRAAVAEILQSALLTDRYVQVGPAYTGGPALGDGGHISADHTRSPISFDDLGASVDRLVVALDRDGPDGKDIGDLVAVTADGLRGNGGRIRELLSASREALATVNAKEPDVAKIAKNLDTIARVLGNNDAMVRRFTGNLSSSAHVVAGQTTSLDRTLRSLSELSTEVSTFIDRNRGKLRANLRDVSRVAATIHGQQDELARIFDNMPVGSENIARAYDAKHRSIRVELAGRDMAFFSGQVRNEFCQSLADPSVCALLTNPQGTGALDLIFDLAEGQLPGWL